VVVARYRLLKEFFSSRKSPQIRNQEVRESRERFLNSRSNSDQRKFPTPIEEIVRCSRGFALCVERHHTYREQS
jgi:hypothetical protein